MTEELKSGIYCIERIETGQQYIGKAANIKRRMNSSHEGCPYIYHAINKYGREAFKRFIVEYCEIDILVEREQYYIKEWNTKYPNGYNLTDGGEGLPGYHHTEESKKLIGMANKGKTHDTSPETKEKIGDGNRGKIRTDEMKENMRNAHIGLHHSQETIDEMKRTRSGENSPSYGTHLSKEQIEQIIIRNTGSHRPEETRAKMRIVQGWTNNPMYGHKGKNSTSQYHCVSKSVSNKGKNIYWNVQIRENKELHYVGLYKTEIEAAIGYDKYVVEHNFPRPLNFPEDYPDYPVFVRKTKGDKK